MANFYEQNFKVLNEKFPYIANNINDINNFDEIEIKDTEEGKVLYYKGACLDNAYKPNAAAKKWVDTQNIDFSNNKNIIIFGFGSGYHIIECIKRNVNSKISVIISNYSLFKKALEIQDLTDAINKITNIISIDCNNFEKYFEGDSEFLIRPQEQIFCYDALNKIKTAYFSKKGFSALSPKIGILGPMQGGTLPMLVYVANALSNLNQKFRCLDMEPFNNGYNYMSKFVKDNYAKGVLDRNYLEMVSQIVVESIREKPIDILICLAQAPITPTALANLRKMGVVTVLWFVEDYLRFTYWKQMAPFYDFIFTIQTGECVDAIKKAGCQNVYYLPVACDEKIHVKQNLSKEDIKRWGSPISFFGAGYHNRQQFFASMCELPFKIWGTEWPTCKPFDRMVQEGGRRLTPQEYTKVFNATTININLHSSTECDGVDPSGDFVNPRTVELASSKAFQLVDKRKLLPDMFKEGEEIITFSNRDELLEKIDYYLTHEDDRQKVIEKSYKRAMKDHTYTSRIREMLSYIYSQKYEYLKNRFENSAWQKMIRRAKPYKELEQRVLVAYKRGEEATLDALVSDIVTGNGNLTETEQKLLFLHHIKSQIIRMSKDDVKKEMA